MQNEEATHGVRGAARPLPSLAALRPRLDPARRKIRLRRSPSRGRGSRPRPPPARPRPPQPGAGPSVTRCSPRYNEVGSIVAWCRPVSPRSAQRLAAAVLLNIPTLIISKALARGHRSGRKAHASWVTKLLARARSPILERHRALLCPHGRPLHPRTCALRRRSRFLRTVSPTACASSSPLDI